MRKITPILVALVVGLAGCGGSSGSSGSATKKNVYPQSAVDNYTRSCTAQGATAKVCGCILDRLRERYTFTQFTQADKNLREGKASGIDFNALAKRCVKG